jgi:predicted ATPase
MKDALARHDAILSEAVAAHRGHVVKTTGDGVHAVFQTARDALDAAATGQMGLAESEWRSTGPLRVRMGMHTGEAQLRDGDYYGAALNRAARLVAVAHGGQVVCSQATADLARDVLPAGMALMDLGEHRLRGLSRAERVFQLQAPGLARGFPTLRSLDALPGNLPAQLTSFVGREEELDRIAQEFAEARLVSLTGVGGVGKTRLAMEAAAEMVAEYRDGAWLVALAGVRDPELVGDALMAVFGLQAGDGRSAIETLLDFFRAKQLLLVLDNCEHLLRPVADLVGAVMQGCPQVRVLATSREGLNVVGERVLTVASLGVPGEGADLDAIESCDAVVLFVDRARSVKTGFTLDASNTFAVAQVCRRLDGIALAIELAAARVAMLTPTELAQRLDQRFRLLAGGQRGVVERHQTLRAAIDWSFELLSEAERLLLARLSVFVGGFSLEAAEAVTAGGGIEADQVFELLSALVARSLVIAESEGIETRFRLLETIRQYAQEHLDQSGDADRIHTRHAVYYASFGEIAIPNTAGPEGIDWERRLKLELDNIGAAVRWAIATQDTDTTMRLFAMWQVPIVVTDATFSATHRWAADMVAAMPGAPEHARYPAALVGTATIAWEQGDQELATRRCDEAIAAEQRLGTEPSILVWLVRANVALAQGRTDDAIEHVQHAVALSRRRDEPAWLAWSLAVSALAHALKGDATAARPDAEEVVKLTRRVANPSIMENALAMAAFALGDSDPERALALALEAVELIGSSERSLSWAIAGDLAARQGDQHHALQYLGRAIENAQWVGNRTAIGTMTGRISDLLAEPDPEASAVLQGAQHALVPSYAHAPHTLEARQVAIATLEASIGTARREELYQQGTAMSDDEAVAYAKAAINRSLQQDAS